MADSEEKLSPEEKLLQVIQGGEQGPGDAPEPPAEPEAPAESEPVAAEPEQPRPKLKLAKEEAPVEIPAEPAAEEAAEDSDVPPTMASSVPELGNTPPETPPVAPSSSVPIAAPLKKETTRRDGVRTVNRWLALAAVAIIALVAYELWANTKPGVAEAAGVPYVDKAPTTEALPPLQEIQETFLKRGIFDLPVTPVGMTNAIAGAANPVLEALKGFDMIGLSPVGDNEYEALVVDRASSKLHFVRKGQQIPVQKEKVEVADVRKDYVLFVYEEREIKVK